MKTLAIFISGLLLTVSGFTQIKKQDKAVLGQDATTPFNGEHIEYYDNGNIQMKATFIDGYANGKVYYYSENGTIKEIQSYKNGLFHGTWEVYNEKGVVISKASFKNGIKDGVWVITDVFNSKKITITYENGKRTDVKFTDEGTGVVYAQ